MNHYFQDIVGWFDFAEIYDLAIFTAKDKDIFVEIGTANGKSTAFLAVEIENSGKYLNLHTVDIFPEQNFNQETNVREHLGRFSNVQVHKCTSKFFINKLKDESIFLLFLDGAHDYETIRWELFNGFKKIRPGGMLAGHDYLNAGHPDVCRAVDEFCNDYNLEYKIIGTSFLIKKPL